MKNRTSLVFYFLIIKVSYGSRRIFPVTLSLVSTVVHVCAVSISAMLRL